MGVLVAILALVAVCIAFLAIGILAELWPLVAFAIFGYLVYKIIVRAACFREYMKNNKYD